MIFVLDACSAINLLHIFKDDDTLLEDIFTTYSITFSEKVLKEVDNNLFSDKVFLELSQKQDIRNIKNSLFEIDKNKDEKSQKYLKNITNYNKLNGEFFSSALALSLSRLEKDYILFVTDDIPAKNEFLSFFEEHRIGDIVSTANFLYILYQLNEEDISIKESFFNLKREYLIEIEGFEQKINHLKLKYQNKKEDYFLDTLISYLKNIEIEKLQTFEIKTRLPLDIKKQAKKIQEYMNQSFTNKKILFDEIDGYLQFIQEKKQYRL